MLEARALARAALLADHLTDALQLSGHLLIGGNNFVEAVRDLAFDAGPGVWQTDGEVTVPHVAQRAQDYGQTELFPMTVFAVLRGPRGTVFHHGSLRGFIGRLPAAFSFHGEFLA